MRSLRLPGALVLAAVVGVALAQPQAPDPNEPGDALPTEPAATEGAVDPERPLDDYEASEQISEDLSVAFPVDI